MALSPKEMHNRIIENLNHKTGKDFAAWASTIEKIRGEKSNKALISELKADHGLGHYTALAILKEITGGNDYSDEQSLINDLFATFPQARKSFENLSEWLLERPEVSRTPCKTYVGFRVKRQFAIARPNKNDVLEIGLSLPSGSDALLSPAKHFGGARITSKLQVQTPILSAAMRSVIERSLKAN